MTNWGQLGLKLVNIAELGPTWLQVGFLWGQPGPKLGGPRMPIQRACRKCAFLPLFTTLFGSAGDVPHVRPVLSPIPMANSFKQDQVAHVKPNLRSNVLKSRHLGPGWAEDGPKIVKWN